MTDPDVNALIASLDAARTDRSLLERPELNQSLDRLRRVGPLPVRCPKCRARFSWWAIHPTDPRIVFNSNGPRRSNLRKDVIPSEQLRHQLDTHFADCTLGPPRGR